MIGELGRRKGKDVVGVDVPFALTLTLGDYAI